MEEEWEAEQQRLFLTDGLVPEQRSCAGKERLDKLARMGQRDLRRLRITGAMSEIRKTTRWGKEPDPWLQRLLDRKPTIQAAVALATQMARALWALRIQGEDYRREPDI